MSDGPRAATSRRMSDNLSDASPFDGTGSSATPAPTTTGDTTHASIARLEAALAETRDRLDEMREERDEHLAARMDATAALGMMRTNLRALASLLQRDTIAAIRAADVLLLPDEDFAAGMLDGDPDHPLSGARAWAANMILLGIEEFMASLPAPNYNEITVDRIGGRFVVTIQRVEGKTPANVAKEALAERDAAVLKAAGLAVRLDGAVKLLRERAAKHRGVIARINAADADPHASVYGNEEQIVREADTRAREFEELLALIEASGDAAEANGS